MQLCFVMEGPAWRQGGALRTGNHGREPAAWVPRALASPTRLEPQACTAPGSAPSFQVLPRSPPSLLLIHTGESGKSLAPKAIRLREYLNHSFSRLSHTFSLSNRVYSLSSTHMHWPDDVGK